MKSFRQFQQMNEGPMLDAAKEGLKDKVAWGLIAAPVPGTALAGAGRMAYKAFKAYKNKKKKVVTA